MGDDFWAAPAVQGPAPAQAGGHGTPFSTGTRLEFITRLRVSPLWRLSRLARLEVSLPPTSEEETNVGTVVTLMIAAFNRIVPAPMPLEVYDFCTWMRFLERRNFTVPLYDALDYALQHYDEREAVPDLELKLRAAFAA